jgi:hypothetical protein
VNYGEGIIDENYDYAVFSQGKEIRDPYSGQILGRKEALVGTLRPKEVASKFAKLSIVNTEEENAFPLQIGMICRPKKRGSFRQNTISREYRSRSQGSNRTQRPSF